MENILVGRKRLEWIAYNYELTTHAKDRIKERASTSKTIRELILNSPLAWKSKDGLVNIAINLYEYMIVYTGENGDKALIITFINTKDSTTNVVDRFIIDYRRINNEQVW